MKKLAFTMAEILLSLTIIGVVAAITLPSLMGNINERTWNTQRKALHARMSQAIAMMPQLNGYGSYNFDVEAWSVTEDSAAEAFLTEGLSKVLKINNICDSDHLADCGVPSKISKSNGGYVYESYPTRIDSYIAAWGDFGNGVSECAITKTAAFETQNGESVLVFYNPNCSGETVPAYGSWHWESRMCVNFLYDLNGNKGPNMAGKDVGFITIFDATDSQVVAPNVKGTVGEDVVVNVANTYCRNTYGDTTRIPNVAEVAALLLNTSMQYNGDLVFSSTAVEDQPDKVWEFERNASAVFAYPISKTTASMGSFCIER